MSNLCDHSSLDTGPCKCMKNCFQCCPCEKPRVYEVWHKDYTDLKADFEAANTTKARQAGFHAMREAGYNVKYLDVRARWKRRKERA